MKMQLPMGPDDYILRGKKNGKTMTEYEDLQVYGQVGLSETESIIVKKTKADAYEYYDIRKFVRAADPEGYTGPTKKGITIGVNNLDAVKRLRDTLTKLIESEEGQE